jgi:hypothetical protein
VAQFYGLREAARRTIYGNFAAGEPMINRCVDMSENNSSTEIFGVLEAAQ